MLDPKALINEGMRRSQGNQTNCAKCLDLGWSGRIWMWFSTLRRASLVQTTYPGFCTKHAGIRNFATGAKACSASFFPQIKTVSVGFILMGFGRLQEHAESWSHQSERYAHGAIDKGPKIPTPAKHFRDSGFARHSRQYGYGARVGQGHISL